MISTNTQTEYTMICMLSFVACIFHTKTFFMNKYAMITIYEKQVEEYSNFVLSDIQFITCNERYPIQIL